MSIVNTIAANVETFMKINKEIYIKEGKSRAESRKNPPENDKELEWAINSEFNSIKQELVQDQVRNDWTAMFMSTIDQANSSYDGLFVDSMVDAIQKTHKTIQSEFWLRMFKVMEKISVANDFHFDQRNEWTKDFLSRMVFAFSHSEEIDKLRKMSEKELSNFRLS